MAAAFSVFFLFLCLRTSFAEEELLPPQNVTIISLNTNYTLSWAWDRRAAQSHNVTFTAQYMGKFRMKKAPKWRTACEQTSLMSCDLTKLNLHYFAIYAIRVRANVKDWHSTWEMKYFHPLQDAAVGPPSKVDVDVIGGDLEVYISDPLTSQNTSMKDIIDKLYFHIMYWERSADPQALQYQTLNTNANVVTLPNLTPWTWYCVRVQSRSDAENKLSTFTSPLCLQTEGATPWWQIVLYFLLSLVICFLIVSFALYGPFWCYKIFKSTFYPTVQLPSYLDYICDSPQSDMPKLLTPDSKSELVCDRVTVCAEPALLEIHSPPPEERFVNYSGFEPDSSGRHSRQSSGGSGDSGVYSTKSSSGLKQISSCQSEESWQTPCDPELVKLRDVDPGLESRRLIIDEGIVDMSV
ncbi:interferon alpha/beta receptor 1b-like [Sphaeramia orbicularis]|uniref:Interferon alpha/beta receptor 1b-like n=1 Tax=Sphaeramia orbicularis TaxID=375764 RepID=A0A673B2J5_9TELE|nr:interferon alpha/beta receptor 1b-like [Sphaeramia orbicularis]